jgi:SAM-dependent methyltransferase
MDTAMNNTNVMETIANLEKQLQAVRESVESPPQESVPTTSHQWDEPKGLPMPKAPQTASPVPTLTSLHSTDTRGPWGDSKYPGNCGGGIIRDLLVYFGAKKVFDPMTGSGTCADVCRDLNIPCLKGDLRDGFDAGNRAHYPQMLFDFVWIHPPYWRQKLYQLDPRDLSAAPSLGHFLDGLARVIRNCATVLQPGGKLAVLMGDYCDPHVGFVPLVYHTKRICFELGLEQRCTEIIRFSHNASSSHKTYTSSFIPGLHDVVTIVEKA